MSWVAWDGPDGLRWWLRERACEGLAIWWGKTLAHGPVTPTGEWCGFRK
jgi:hypothetical protein